MNVTRLRFAATLCLTIDICMSVVSFEGVAVGHDLTNNYHEDVLICSETSFNDDIPS